MILVYLTEIPVWKKHHSLFFTSADMAGYIYTERHQSQLLKGGNVARIIQDRANTNRCDGTADRHTATITGRAKVCGVKARGCVFYRLVYKYRKLYIL